MKKIDSIHNIFKNTDFTEKIQIYFSTKVAGHDFDEYSQNYTHSNLNPLTIRGRVRQLTPEQMAWKPYGKAKMGSVEVIAEERYESWFKAANKVVINGDQFEVYNDGTGLNSFIQKRPNKTIRVVLAIKRAENE